MNTQAVNVTNKNTLARVDNTRQRLDKCSTDEHYTRHGDGQDPSIDGLIPLQAVNVGWRNSRATGRLASWRRGCEWYVVLEASGVCPQHVHAADREFR